MLRLRKMECTCRNAAECRLCNVEVAKLEIAAVQYSGMTLSHENGLEIASVASTDISFTKLSRVLIQATCLTNLHLIMG